MIDLIATAVLLLIIFVIIVVIFPHVFLTIMDTTGAKSKASIWFLLAMVAIIFFIVFVIDPMPPWRAAVNYTAPVEQVYLPCLC